MTSSWLDSAEGGTTADLAALRPDLAALIAQFDAQAATSIGDRLRSLLEARVAQLVGDAVTLEATDAAVLELARTWPTNPEINGAERAALDLCESFVMDAHSVTDDQVVRLQQLLGDDGAVAVFMNLALLDGFTKFRRVFAEGNH